MANAYLKGANQIAFLKDEIRLNGDNSSCIYEKEYNKLRFVGEGCIKVMFEIY